ncbi:MAG: ribbon-helix-helix protein, CopG family [Methanothrix sp.]|nr:ribbon-helix-helix protein, CopG family [Methanothrix sp.]
MDEAEAKMKLQGRITIALDEGTSGLFQKLKDEMGISQSELMREALKFFGKHKMLFDLCDDMTVYTYSEMLSAGEHIILDINHWMLFMSFMETHPDKEKFWSLHREICRAHAEQFKLRLFNAESILRRGEICNLFNISKTGDKEFNLIFNLDSARQFIRIELEEIFAGMDYVVEIKENFSKLRVKVIDDL